MKRLDVEEMPATNASGSSVSINANIQWFRGNESYAKTQASLAHYRYVALMVNREIQNAGEMLDVGNGGFFNYDTTRINHVTALDLFLHDGPGPLPNTTFRRGSILDMPFKAGRFDFILLQNVLHHLTSRSVRQTHENLAKSVAELFRCIRPGGRVLIIESTVGRWFYALEGLMFPLLFYVKRGGHPVTLQFTPDQLLAETRSAGFDLVEYADVPTRGMLILQFGRKWPTCLTPARPVKLLLAKPR
jgi:SAM-dependent methyltransferase